MNTHLTPLEVCERLIGPLEKLALIAQTHPKSPFHWRRVSGWRAAGDMPPRVNRIYLAYSDAHALGLTPAHLILGASGAEVAAILASRNSAPDTQVAA